MRALYFAYGSNMLAERLRAVDRAPRAEPLCTARLTGFSLRFHKRGGDGSGKCDAFRTGADVDGIHGVVYRLSETELTRLDRTEGIGYERISVRVRDAGRGLEVTTYVAAPSFVEPGLDPFDWYLSLVAAGARQHRLPSSYVEQFGDIVARPDPNDERRARALAVLERAAAPGGCDDVRRTRN